MSYSPLLTSVFTQTQILVKMVINESKINTEIQIIHKINVSLEKMHKFSFKKENSGFSMIEMLFAACIMGIIGIVMSSFLKKNEGSNARFKAKSYSQRLNSRVLDFVKRDLKYQTSFQVKNNGLSFEITRRKMYDGVDTSDTYTVTYTTRCADIPSKLKSSLQNYIYTPEKNRNEIYSDSHKCLERLKDSCASNQYPQLFIDYNTNDQRIPAYKPNIFPNLNLPSLQRSLRKRAAGVALCAGTSNDRVEVMVNTIYLAGKVDKRETVRVSSDQMLLSSKNVSGAVLLQRK